MPMEEVSATGSSVLLEARRRARMQAKAQGLESTWAQRMSQKGRGGGKGKGGSCAEGDWNPG